MEEIQLDLNENTKKVAEHLIGLNSNQVWELVRLGPACPRWANIFLHRIDDHDRSDNT